MLGYCRPRDSTKDEIEVILQHGKLILYGGTQKIHTTFMASSQAVFVIYTTKWLVRYECDDFNNTTIFHVA